MKKLILIILLCLITTGCFGSKGKGILSTTCTKEEKIYDLTEKSTYTFEYYKGMVNKVILTNEYSGEDMTNYIDTYKLVYSNYTGISISTENNKIIYTFDVANINEDAKKIFNIKDTYNEQVNYLENDNYTCK